MGRTKDALKLAIGRLAELAFPQMAHEIDEARNTAQAPMFKRAILHARLQRSKARGDHGAVEKALSAFWKSNAGDAFHESYSDVRFELFLERHYMVIDALCDLLERNESRFHRLVEIGCGDGRVLAHCFEQMPAISSAVGLDINAAIIKRVSAEHDPADGLAFVEADGTAWLESNPAPGTVLFSNGGVLEYFSPKNLDRLFRTLAAHPPAAVVLIEPVALDHDLENECESKVFGYESSFSHNHRYRLNHAGFEVLHCTELRIGDVRWLLMLGTCPSGP